jgi:hypothetical protein
MREAQRAKGLEPGSAPGSTMAILVLGGLVQLMLPQAASRAQDDTQTPIDKRCNTGKEVFTVVLNPGLRASPVSRRYQM